jgi:hypothetical protein
LRISPNVDGAATEAVGAGDDSDFDSAAAAAGELGPASFSLSFESNAETGFLANGEEEEE